MVNIIQISYNPIKNFKLNSITTKSLSKVIWQSNHNQTFGNISPTVPNSTRSPPRAYQQSYKEKQEPTWKKRREKEKRENTQHCIVYKKITPRSVREEREPRGAKVEGWRRVESYIFLETAREKSRPLRGSCPRGHLSRAKESEPKRKRSQRGYGPKEAGWGGK